MVEALKEFCTVLLGQRLKIYTDHKKLARINFSTDRLLRWRLILEECGPDIEYIRGEKNIAAYALSLLPNSGNQYITHEQTYTTETMSYFYDTEELPEGTFTQSFNLVDRYQREDPFQTEKNKCAEFTKGSFRGGQNTIYPITYKDKIFIRSEMVSHVSASSRNGSNKVNNSPTFLLERLKRSLPQESHVL